MQDNYHYFSDPRALAEIQKHKWLESQKQGREIGFASAAMDWIKNYGEAWKKIHAVEKKDKRVFIEKRKYRRFNLNQLIKLVKDNVVFLGEGVNLSFFGLMCKVREFLPVGSRVNAYVPIELETGEKIICPGTVERIIHIKPEKYELFLKFDNTCQEQLENCKYFQK